MKAALKLSNGQKLNERSIGSWSLERRPGGWILARDGQRQVRISLERRAQKLWFASGGFALEAEIQDRERGSSQASGDEQLIAQFPGKVRKILVREGSSAKLGDALLLVEAMKMEFTIQAPFPGKIGRILVKEGQQIAPGDRFLEMIQEGTAADA